MADSNHSSLFRLRRITSQVCGSEPLLGHDEEGCSPLAPEEDSGILLPDSRRKRRLPDLPHGALDVKATAKRYEEERQKRLDARPVDVYEGRTLQYPRLADLARIDPRFAKMFADPYVQTPARAPLMDEVDYAILGAGYGGLSMGARLRENGVPAKDIRIFDRAGDVGGTWYWNRYPGAMCDVESFVYMLLCEEMGYIPTEKYAHQPEILLHCQMIAERYGLYENACLGTEVNELRWNESTMRWIIHTNRGDAIKAKFAIVNFGVFSHPKLPGVPGLDQFEGHMFHTSRWDYEYTGGSSVGALDKLAEKRVAIIGTGATAVQAIPYLGRHSRHLYVFQRTPSTIDVRNNFKTTPEFAAEYMSKKGWQKERFMNFLQNCEKPTKDLVDLVSDGWTHARARATKVLSNKGLTSSQIEALMEKSDFEHEEQIRKRVDAVVHDKATADALKPWYRLWCKRPCFHDDYLATFNRPNVTLIDTHGTGIERLTKKGIFANGKEYEVDCIVLSTGFEPSWTLPATDGTALSKRKTQAHGFEIYGRGGVSLADHWVDGPKTLNSFQTRGFPNIFWMNGPQGVIANSATILLDEMAIHLAKILAKLKRESKHLCEPSEHAQNKYCEMVFKSSTQAQRFYSTCTPGYYNNEGQVQVGQKTLASWYPGGTPGLGGIPKFLGMLHRQQAEDDMFEGLDVV